MILIATYQGCFDQLSFTSVCADTSQIAVSVTDTVEFPQCTTGTNPPLPLTAVAVPKSSLPFNWQFTVVKQ